MQCGFIGHSKDVDFGVYAKDFDEDMIEAMQQQGLHLSHRCECTTTLNYTKTKSQTHLEALTFKIVQLLEALLRSIVPHRS